MINIIDKFIEIYKHAPEGEAFCPYRVCPIGAHIDHQLGIITGYAIDKGISFAYSPKKNGVVELTSLNFDKRAQFHINAVPDEKQNDWADLLRGAVKELTEKYTLTTGVCGVIKGDLPIGGLSSSAAVTIAFLIALCRVNGIKLTEHEMILTAKAAENRYVGVSCGKLDQSTEIYSKKDYLLYLDTKDDSFELIKKPENMKPFDTVIIFSGLERSLAQSGFNVRVDECRAAAYAMKAFDGEKYGKFEHTCLRDVEKEDFERLKERLPESWKKRAEHFYGEMSRVKEGAEAWRRGDIEKFGKLCFLSGKSSIENYQTGSDELIKIYKLMTETDGVYGGRFSGAGFKGCCLALTDPRYTENAVRKISEKYLADFPHLKDKFSVHVCKSANGAEF